MSQDCPGDLYRYRETACLMRNVWEQLACIRGDVAIIVHGPSGCGWDFSLPDRRGDGVCHATDLTEMDVIMGGEEALEKKIESVCARARPRALFVLGTCVSRIIGDDARGLCAQAEAKWGVPVLYLPTSGLADPSAPEARSLVMDALIGKIMKPGRRVARSVNFLSRDWPNYTQVRKELARHLSALGLRLNALLTGDPVLEEIAAAPRAALNVIVSDPAAEAIGARMREKFGTPFLVVPRPTGIAATSRMYELVAEASGGGAGPAARVRGWRRRETERLPRAHPGLNGRRVAVLMQRPDPYVAGVFSELGLRATLRAGASGPPAASWDGFDLVYCDVPGTPAPGSHLPLRHMRPLSSFLLYSGMRELARELDAELGSRFFPTFGRYCA